MLRSFFLSREWLPWAWGGLLLLCVMIGAEVAVQVWINGWYRETWDFLQSPHPLLKEAVHSAETDWTKALPEASAAGANLAEVADSQLSRFWGLIGEFCIIVFPYIFLRTFTTFFARHYAFRWRQAITFAYIPLWAKSEHDIEGASQRLQEDPAKFAALLQNLGLGFFRDMLTLIAFLPILWSITKEISVNFAAAAGLGNAPFDLPFLQWTAQTAGSLMWVALLLAVGGTFISYFVGIKLPGLEYNNQKVEARFRKQLTYGEDDKQYANMSTLAELFTGLRFNYFRLYLHYTYFGVWASTFSQFLVIADLILIGSGVVLGVITLGFVNQISHAFSKVSDSLAYFIDNWTTVTELLSVIRRLREFERSIGYAGPPLAGDELPVQAIR